MIRDPYIRWCEEVGSELIATCLLDYRQLSITAGYNQMRLINTGTLWHEVAIYRFKSDTFSIPDYIDGITKGIDFPLSSTDIVKPGMTIPKDSNEVILNLMPGKYGIICTIDNHLMAGMNKEFYVVNNNAASYDSPKEDILLTISDTAFTFSKPVSSGMLLVKIINKDNKIMKWILSN